MVALSGHAYPWDVLGDPDFPRRVTDTGLTSVTLAAAYHSTRAATPLHPRHQLVDAAHAALYRPIRESAWSGRRLLPGSPQWMDDPDPFGTATKVLTDNGIAVTAWLVLTHSTRLGTEFGELAVVNCFGERYRYALCPAQREVRDYAATLAAEAVRDVSLAGVSIEACGQLGLTHLGHHEKTDGAWGPAAARWLSVCCCAACAAEWAAAGCDPNRVRARLRTAVRDDEADIELSALLLDVRHRAADRLRANVLDAIGDDAPVTLHAQADPWATGPSPGLTPSAAADVAALLVPAWPTTVDSVAAVREAARTGTPTHAYVTVLPPAEPDEVVAHTGRLMDAGARGLGIYHLGLASRTRQRAIGQIVTAITEQRGNPAQ